MNEIATKTIREGYRGVNGTWIENEVQDTIEVQSTEVLKSGWEIKTGRVIESTNPRRVGIMASVMHKDGEYR